MKFSPCIGVCTKKGLRCEGCDRTHEEIAETKQMVMALVSFAKKNNYENIEEFSNAIGKSVLKKLQKSMKAN